MKGLDFYLGKIESEVKKFLCLNNTWADINYRMSVWKDMKEKYDIFPITDIEKRLGLE